MRAGRVRCAAGCIGIDARAALRAGAHGSVIAAFRRSVYLRLPGGVVCIGGAAIGEGPLNILCPNVPGRDWRDLAAVGDRAQIVYNLIGFSHVSVDLARAATSLPPAPPRPDPTTLAAGLAALMAELPGALPEGGLGALIAPGAEPEDGIARAAAAAGARVAAWLGGGAGCERDVPEDSVRALLGLGPGLTPSGDDYLAGFALALRLLGAHRHHARLVEAIEVLSPDNTNEISAAHLAAALRGRVRADLHVVMDAVLRADRRAIAEGLRRLAAEDHHSPWDALAGFASAARACLPHLTRSACETV